VRPAFAAPGRPGRSRTNCWASASTPRRLRERRDEHHPGVRHHALIIEFDLRAVRSDRLVMRRRTNLLDRWIQA
jgi:hypothetical protein